MKENESWPVVIGQKGSIVLPEEMLAFAGEHDAYSLSVRHVLLRLARSAL